MALRSRQNLCSALGLPLLVSLLAGQVMASDYIWWEAESFSDSSSVTPERHDVLSGGQWVYIDETGTGEPRFIEFDNIQVPEPGTWHLYARKFWRHGPYTWRFNGGEDGTNGTVDGNVALIDQATLRLHTEANWTYAGRVTLTEGGHRLRVELARHSGVAAFDAFVLSREPFPFRGKYRPDDIISAAESGWFPWHSSADTYQESPLDLRYLNETQAGMGGFIQSEDESFVHGSSQEIVRFWGVSAGQDVVMMDALSARLYARDMAKYGVNLVRVHFPLYDGDGTDFHQLNPERIDGLYRFISILKDEGIYTSLSLYFPLWVNLGPDDPRFANFQGNPLASIFFDETLQAVYRHWWRELLTTPNPYTGIALKDEPAIFSLEMVNEDSLLFWTFSEQNIPEASMAALQTRFALWLQATYGPLWRVRLRWWGFWHKDDAPAQGRIGLLPIYDLSRGRTQRARDTARFLTELQRDFFQRHYDFLKTDLGFGGIVSASNWRTANELTLGPLDKHSNTVGDFMDRHAYFEPLHEDEGDGSAAFSLRVGHRYQDRSSLSLLASGQSGEAGERGFAHPVLDITYNDKPSVLSEVNWPMPNRYRADMPFLLATYGRMQGLDAIINFASSPGPWDLQHSKFSTHSPVIKGQWLAAALAFRRGYTEEGLVVAEAELPLEGHLFELEGSPLSLLPNPDMLRLSDQASVAGDGSLHPLTLLAGRAKVSFTSDGEYRFQVADNLDIDLSGEYVGSANGQLHWDFGRGYSTVNAPKLQGATGFLSAAGELVFDDMSLQSAMDYGSIWLISLDDQPLERSESMLLMVMSEEKTHGWQTSADQDGRHIEALGQAPFMLREVQGHVELKRPDANQLVISQLDQRGYPVTEMLVDNEKIDLAPETVYYHISTAGMTMD